MANIVSKKNKDGVVRGWEVRTKIPTANGSTYTYYAPAKIFDKSEVDDLKTLLAACEKDVAITGAIQPFTIGRLKPFPSILDDLVEKGIIDAAPYTTLGDVYDEALVSLERTAKPRTRTTAQNCLKYVLDYFKKDKPITEIKQRDAQAFNSYLNDLVTAGKLAQTTKNAIITRSKWLFRWYSDQLPEPIVNPFQSIKGGSTVSEKEPRFITDEEATRILDAIAKHSPPRAYYNPREWKAYFLLGYRQGLRLLSEASEFKWEFIDFDNKVLMIRDVKRSKRSKGAKWRNMRLFSDTAAALWELKEEQKRNGDALVYVFSDWWRQDNKNNGASVYARLKMIFQEAGVDADRFRQILRQTASNRIDNEYGDRWENLMLGHSGKVARSAYLLREIPKEVLERVPSWEKAATD